MSSPKTDPNAPAMPVAPDAMDAAGNWMSHAPGLTKREWFAGLAMQGLLADPRAEGSHERFAVDCVAYADALIAALNEKEASHGE